MPSSTKGQAVFLLDDRPYTISPQIEMLDHYGFETRVFTGPNSLLLALDNPEGFERDIAAILIDALLGDEADLRSIGAAGTNNRFSNLSGVNLARRLAASNRFHVPIAILSSYQLDPGERIGGRDAPLLLLRKSSPLEFEEFVRSLVALPNVLPEFSLGAIITPISGNSDGTSIELIQPAYDRLVKLLVENPRLMYEIDWRKWEEIIAASYAAAGFDEVILTPRSGDLGRDVIATKRGFGSVKFIDQMKAKGPGELVTAEEVRALAGVLSLEQDASKAVFFTTGLFAPRVREDRLLKPLFPTRLELVDKSTLIERLSWRTKT